MEWLLFLVAGGGAGSYAVWKLRERRDERRRDAEQVEAVRRLAEEDVTVFGEQLQSLGTELDGRDLGTAAARDYQQALDIYERAKFAAPRLGEPGEISTLVDTLANGRYSMACVRARVAGTKIPELRLPCFFNPQHGPSFTDVMYTSARRGTRMLPACRQCAARVAEREPPDVRTVRLGARTIPYWEAGEAYLPYTQGNFVNATWAGATVSWLWETPAAGFSGYDGGGYEGGGYGGHFGPGDFSGGDFGGGDGGGGT
jgi:hypothetical protein